ncbi:unnamed protein product [Clonostachys chloroleuca]|uniref:BHLH domain-containing protein n=1 Tax=Clonostachys chloroleuca TaxID=1926264 RepID=A0AA35QAA7_9HYPO|nr:unnamed protein product [Clonostachys chloroleuca]
MPRPNLPPTPGSLSDLKGQDGTQKLASLNISLELPPPALHDVARISPPTDQHGQSQLPPSPQSTYPMQAAETVKARRRSSTAKENTFALPPPPTRSRKIIQMKPPQDEASDSTVTNAANSTTKGKESGKGKGATSASKAPATGAAGSGGQQGKKKQPSATSAAGRKIARKTAHSLIERRRRSKMNEEFALLKSMIPACTGEMHKLAILQASIEYVRYLEDCVSKLKAQHDQDQSRGLVSQLPSIREFHPTFRDDTADVEMTDSEAVSPTFTAVPDHPSNMHPRHPSVSPALYAQDARGRQHSYSSVSTEHRNYSYSSSAGTSPAFGPQTQGPYATSNAGSTLTSPALNPQSDLDQEATAALLMLNSDRRGYAKGASRRTVSVRDLLST